MELAVDLVLLAGALVGVWYAWRAWSRTLDRLGARATSSGRRPKSRAIDGVDIGRRTTPVVRREAQERVPSRVARAVIFSLTCAGLLVLLAFASGRPWAIAVPAVSFGGAAVLAGLARARR